MSAICMSHLSARVIVWLCLMKSVGSHGSSSLPFMMKVKV
jgi:hypothetical protein